MARPVSLQRALAVGVKMELFEIVKTLAMIGGIFGLALLPALICAAIAIFNVERFCALLFGEEL